MPAEKSEVITVRLAESVVQKMEQIRNRVSKEWGKPTRASLIAAGIERLYAEMQRQERK